MSETTAMLLTRDLLEAFERVLVDVHPPLVDRWRPGLSEAEMDGLADAAGIRLPAEARVWWGWRDGVLPAPGDRASLREFGPNRQFLPFAEVVDWTVWYRQNPRIPWPPGWLLWTTRAMALACDVEPGAASPVHMADFGAFGDDVAIPVAQSMGDMVATWVTAIERGAWWYDPSRELWFLGPEDLPADARRARMY